jgi:hypothetical protein
MTSALYWPDEKSGKFSAIVTQFTMSIVASSIAHVLRPYIHRNGLIGQLLWPSAELAAATLKTTGTFAPLPSLPPAGVLPRQANANLEVRPIRPKMPERH